MSPIHRILISAILLLLTSTAIAQSEISLLKVSDKKSSRPISLVTGGPSEMKAGIEHKVLVSPDNSVVILAGEELYKFDAGFRKLWAADLSGLFRYPKFDTETLVASGRDATYVIEAKAMSTGKISVIQVLGEGKAREKTFEIYYNDIQPFEPFVLDGNLYLMGKNLDRKNRRIVYKLFTITREDMSLSEKQISLPSDEFEYKELAKSRLAVEYLWKPLKIQEDNVILSKSYFKKLDGSELHQLNIYMAEIDPDGNISNEKQFYFQPKLNGDDRKFVQPTIAFNSQDQSVLFTGYMSIDKKNLNGLYLLKYDYATASPIYVHEHHFADILKPEIKPRTRVNYIVYQTVNEAYPLEIRSDDVHLDYRNNFVTIRIITAYGFNSLTFFEVKFDKYGDHVKTAVVGYPGMLQYFDNYLFNPDFYQMLWEDKERPHVNAAKMTTWEFVNEHANEGEKNVFWIPISISTGNRVIRFDKRSKTFTGFLVE